MTNEEYLDQVSNEVRLQVRQQYPNLDFFVSVEDPRYPKIIFQDNPNNEGFDNAGYWWDADEEKIGSRFCICSAHCPCECICGAWDDPDFVCYDCGLNGGYD